MRLLVTGGAGFIGSNVVHGLLPRPEVARLVQLAKDTGAADVDFNEERDKGGGTALWWAVWNGHAECVRTLWQYLCNIGVTVTSR